MIFVNHKKTIVADCVSVRLVEIPSKTEENAVFEWRIIGTLATTGFEIILEKFKDYTEATTRFGEVINSFDCK